MPPYPGYQPNYNFIADAAATIGGGVGTAINQNEEYKRELDKARKIAEADRKKLSIVHMALQNQLQARLDPLVNAGVMTQDEAMAMKAQLIKPDKFPDFDTYHSVTGGNYDNLMAKIDKKEADWQNKQQQQRIGTDIVNAYSGGGQQPQEQQPQTPTAPPTVGYSGTPAEAAGNAAWGEEQTPTIGGPALGPEQGAAAEPYSAEKQLSQQGYTQQQLASNPYWAAKENEKRQAMKDKELQTKKDRLDYSKQRAKLIENNLALQYEKFYQTERKMDFDQTRATKTDLNEALNKKANQSSVVADIEDRAAAIKEEIVGLEAQVNDPAKDPEDIDLIQKKLEAANKESAGLVSKLSAERLKQIKYDANYERATNADIKYMDEIAQKKAKTISTYTKGHTTSTQPTASTPVIGPSPTQQPAPTPTPAPAVTPKPAINIPNATNKPIKGSTENDVRTMTPAQIEIMIAKKIAEWRKISTNEQLIKNQEKVLRERIAAARASVKKGK